MTKLKTKLGIIFLYFMRDTLCTLYLCESFVYTVVTVEQVIGDWCFYQHIRILPMSILAKTLVIVLLVVSFFLLIFVCQLLVERRKVGDESCSKWFNFTSESDDQTNSLLFFVCFLVYFITGRGQCLEMEQKYRKYTIQMIGGRWLNQGAARTKFML